MLVQFVLLLSGSKLAHGTETGENISFFPIEYDAFCVRTKTIFGRQMYGLFSLKVNKCYETAAIVLDWIRKVNSSQFLFNDFEGKRGKVTSQTSTTL